MRKFYVCSYGGSGSTLLWKRLETYGESYHIHSRVPPTRLQYLGKNPNAHKQHLEGDLCYREWFNQREIPEEEVKDYTVIFIYKNPISAIISRYRIIMALGNFQLDPKLTIEQVIESGEDLYKIKEFYNNYTTSNQERNYKIICVKYADLFDKQDELSQYLGIGPLNLLKRENNRKKDYDLYFEGLYPIYKDMIDEIELNPFIFEV